jgi:hypothetical protein
MFITSLFFTLKKNKKVEFFFGDYQPSDELSAILEEKNGTTQLMGCVTNLLTSDRRINSA